MMDNLDNKIECIPVVQNQQEFLVGVFKIEQILKFTRYTHRLILNYDENNNPEYNKQVQRQVENSRVEKIADFLINDPEATFPTNIVLHIPTLVIDKQEKSLNSQIIRIWLDNKVFTEVQKENLEVADIFITIIDGQHRIKGIEVAISRLRIHIDSISRTLRTSENESLQKKLQYYSQRLKDLLNIQLIVSFFVDKTLEYQAMIFSTINRTQKKVSESLVYSLFGLDTRDTPQKTALQVVLALNSNKFSPFFNRIKLYGGNYERNQSPPLTQATMVKSIISLISENIRESENDRHKTRKELMVRTKGSIKYLPFREYYIKNMDTKISDIL
ncbi:MAG: DGQHR domain-containing protein, partial [Cytophagales bacterium]|nr:DGQHR domain-containing protein [Cytophagales bacterium]